jgi:hypothetical protein
MQCCDVHVRVARSLDPPPLGARAQFLLSLAHMLASDVGQSLPVGVIISRNLVPATIGNIIGGGFFVGAFYAGEACDGAGGGGGARAR